MYFVTKTYGHELGLSACFRQWRATSHCRHLHGYPLSFKLTFSTDQLDENGWVIDFGGLKTVKAWLCDTFDHKLLVAADDPEITRLVALSQPSTIDDAEWSYKQLADILIVPGVGCESFAKYVFEHVFDWLGDMGHMPRVTLVSVEVREHGGNSAIYQNENVK